MTADRTNDEVSLLQLARILVQERRVVIALVGIGLGIGVLAAILRPEVYSSTAVITAAGRSGTANRFAGLASQLGLSDGGSEGASGITVTPELLEVLAESDVLLGRLVDDSTRVGSSGLSGSLMATFASRRDASPAIKRLEVIRSLKRAIATRKNKMTGTLEIEVNTTSPRLSHAIALAVVAELNGYVLSLGRQQASEERRFVSASLNERKAQLTAAENRVASFLLSNRQYQSSPQLVLEYERLQREVALHQQVLVRLSQALEEAGIREARDTPVVVVLEPAEVPLLPNPRKRLQILALGLFGGLILGALAAFGRFAFTQWRSGAGRDWMIATSPAPKS
jgi:uncharacterized protein involved in exopolysaccharide biosynthesis